MDISTQNRLTLSREREHLATAERDVLQGERRVADQAELLERLRRDGHDTGQAQMLLETLKQTLSAWRDHREQILRIISRLEHEED